MGLAANEFPFCDDIRIISNQYDNPRQTSTATFFIRQIKILEEKIVCEFPDWKNYNDQTYNCPRGWCLSIMNGQLRVIMKPLEHRGMR